MNLNKKFLSVIIPLYNEEKRINNLHRIYKYLSIQKFNWEIILVNDGSVDTTKNTINKMLKSYNFKHTRLISYSQNKGKGFAVKTGILAAKGKYRLFTDIDLSTPIEEFDKFLPYLEKFSIIIGSRRIKGSEIIIHQPNLREEMGKGFTKLSQIILQIKVTDFTCGFKCFSNITARKIFDKQTINMWGFDAEILFLAKKFGYKIKEIPVRWSNDPRSRVKFPQDIISSLSDLFKIRYNEFKKRYG